MTTSIKLPYGIGMVPVEDRESPWGTYDDFNPEIEEWLQIRTHEWEWGWDFDNNGVIVTIRDINIALLFKLTWGGVLNNDVD